MARTRAVVIVAALAAMGLIAAGLAAAHHGRRAGPSVRAPDADIAFPLHTRGAFIVDSRGKRVKLSLVNWYGAESPDYVVGGLAYEPLPANISRIVSMGFTGVRRPW